LLRVRYNGAVVYIRAEAIIITVVEGIYRTLVTSIAGGVTVLVSLFRIG
jgi:hypothetical protein